MKRTLLALAALASLLTACGQNTKNEAKVLVAYFSATGTTRTVAENVAKASGATLYEIAPVEKYTAEDLDWTKQDSRSSVEMKDPESRPAIENTLQEADSYDVIFIGFPVWWYTAPTIINTFLDTYDFTGKKVVFFATSGGSDLKKADAQFAQQYPGLKWQEGKLLNGASEEEIKAWTDKVIK